MTTLHFIDWAIIIGYTAVTVVLGLYFARRASGGINDFFISGRQLPWWLAGTSMVATSFAADTPLAVTEMVVKDGIAGNWYWWSFAIQGLMVTFLFSKFWRRAEIVTDVEFFELRYSGKAAAFLRGFKAFLGAIIANSIIMGWVMLAMATVVQMVFGWDPVPALGLCIVIALGYSVVSGLWGVVATDFLQFFIAMGGSVLLCVQAVKKVGGLQALREGAIHAAGPEVINFIPSPGKALFTTFLIYLSVQWWCASNSDSGGGILVQRMSATKDPRESMRAILWFNIAHYCLRAWPWILSALAVLVLYPGLENPRLGYPKLMIDILPTGMRGLILASFLAAFMSTVDTHLNWASSYLVNDVYKRFIKPHATERHYVMIGRLGMVGIAILAAVGASQMTSIEKAWKFLTLMGAGAGMVKILRWYWWRINAWSEISAIAASLTFSILIQKYTHLPFGERLAMNVAASAVVWITVTFLTSPTETNRLTAFYRKVKPSPRFWGPIARANPEVRSGESLTKNVQAWGVAVLFIYSFMFAIGKALLLEPVPATASGVIALFSGAYLFKTMSRDTLID
ncbi:MAG TPA: Na+:solute symporter [Thermoanaerobaculia bacterium]|nr:Na+:solute symporter [Thermoanaerobaculia bacterium]HUM31296.1 Na+:solute symporter [Thermoanaerobaculia bacterium]HXK69650.1 Na+:solute symporter [Thermoanaerobaculia bacterium]